PHLGEARARDEADVAGSDNSDLHSIVVTWGPRPSGNGKGRRREGRYVSCRRAKRRREAPKDRQSAFQAPLTPRGGARTSRPSLPNRRPTVGLSCSPFPSDLPL